MVAARIASSLASPALPRYGAQPARRHGACRGHAAARQEERREVFRPLRHRGVLADRAIPEALRSGAVAGTEVGEARVHGQPGGERVPGGVAAQGPERGEGLAPAPARRETTHQGLAPRERIRRRTRCGLRPRRPAERDGRHDGERERCSAGRPHGVAVTARAGRLGSDSFPEVSTARTR